MEAEVAPVVEQLEDGVGDRADARLDRGAVGDALGDQRGDHGSRSRRERRRQLDERVVGLGVADDLIEVERVLAERARHVRVHLDEEGERPDEARGVVGVRAQRHVAVPVGWRRGGQHEGPRRVAVQHERHLAEVHRHEVAGPGGERRRV